MTDILKNKWLKISGLIVLVLVSFSNLFTFADRISSKPTEAGYWMIMVFGLTLGAAAVGIPLIIRDSKK